jgi:hypothetical protein
MRSPFDSSPEIFRKGGHLWRVSVFERLICGTAAPNPRGMPRDARSPAHGVPGPVSVRSRLRDMGRGLCRASGRSYFPTPTTACSRWQQYRRSAGPDSGIGVADEDFTFVEAALQVVETFASRFTPPRSPIHVGDSETSTLWPGRRTAYERQTAARPHHCSPP